MSKPRRATSHRGRRGHPRRRYRRLAADDTLLSGPMLISAVHAILKWAKLDRKHDVPYLAGYSRDGRTIYIDKDLPKSFVTRGGKLLAKTTINGKPDSLDLAACDKRHVGLVCRKSCAENG